MDQEEENKYVSQLQEVFSSCDTTGTGYLDKEELTDLCHKLHLDAQLPLLLQTLLGNDHFARVNFEEFKEGFVAVLSSTIDVSISEDDSSYLEPVIPDEVKPKFVKGTKRYGRRTRPELDTGENEANKFLQEQHNVKSKRKSQLRRSSSLESVESLKSDEEAESGKEPQNENFEAQGQLRTWNTDIFDRPRRNSSPCSDMTENQVRDIWEELGIGHNGYLNQQELDTVCKNIGLKDLSKEELEDLFKKLDRDGDGRVSFQEFQVGLFSHAPLPLSSTPLKQRRPWTFYQPADDSSRRTATPSLLSGFGGFHLFSSIDDGTGFGSPEQIIIIWEEEGIEDSKDILTSLDFSLEEQVNLLELTTALDNELIATKNRVHLAALASYKHELYYQHGHIDQVTRERDKVKQDLEKAEKRNLQLADEVDDHNSVMEHLNESKIRELEQEYRQRLSTIRSELESEQEQFMQQNDQHRSKLEADLANFQMEEAYLREKLNLSIKENSRLRKEMVEIVGKLTDSENQVLKLQTSLDNMLKEKTDPHSSEFFNQEERFAEIIKEYEAQCRELRDRNDELQMQLETLRSQLSESKYSRLLAKMKDNKLLHHKAKEKIHNNHVNNGAHGKRSLSTKLRRSLSAAGGNVPATIQSEPSPENIEAELMKHQLKEQEQEIQDLKIQLETKVNYYEREVELMKTNFEKERKDTEHSFKIEITELEEQKADLEELNAKYQEVIDGLKAQLPKSSHYQEMEKMFEKERAEIEQYYAKEISALGQRLTNEKEQLEEELKRTHQHELQSMRQEAEEELNQKLADIEAQYTDYCQNIFQQHYSEKKAILEMHEMDKKTIAEEHISERTCWEERLNALMVQFKKEQLKLEEKHNEEQARICKTFAIEKKSIESHYRMQLDRLSKEIEGLNALLLNENRGDCTDEKERQPLVKGQTNDCLNEELVDINTATFAQSKPMTEAILGRVHASDKDQINALDIDCTTNIVEQDEFIEMNIKQTETQNLKYQHDLFSLKAAEERLSLLKKAEESAAVKLQEMESLVSTLRAQLQDEIKAKETLQRHQEGFEEEQAQLCSQLTAWEEKCLLSEVNIKQLRSQLQDSMLQQLTRDKKELNKEVLLSSGQPVELENKMNVGSGNEQELTSGQLLSVKEIYTEQNACKSSPEDVHVKKTDRLEEQIARNALLSQQLKSKEEELRVLQNEMREAMSHLQQIEDEATKKIHDAKEEIESEKISVKEKLFELEDLVRELERETRASQDDRMELSRLSEDNCLLRNKVEQLQKEVYDLEDVNNRHRKQVQDLMKEKDKAENNLEELNKQNQKYQDEVHQLNTQSLKLSDTVSDLSAQNVANQQIIQDLNIKLREVTQQKEEVHAAVEQLQETLGDLEREKIHQLSEWHREREQLERELQMSEKERIASTTVDNTRHSELLTDVLTDDESCTIVKGKIQKYQGELHQLNAKSVQLSCSVSDLSAQSVDNQETIQQLNIRLREVTQQKEEATTAVEQLQETLTALEREKVHQLSEWQRQREQLQRELQLSEEKIQKYQDELHQLNAKSVQLSGSVSDLSAQTVDNQDTIQQLNIRLREVTQQKEGATTAVEQLQETLTALEREKVHQLSEWQREREQLQRELQLSEEKNEKYHSELCQLNAHSVQLSDTVSDLSAQNVDNHATIQDINIRLNEVTQQKEEAAAAVLKLQETLGALEKERVYQLSLWQREKEQLEDKIQKSNDKIQNLIDTHKQEKEELLHGLDQSNKQLFIMEALQEEVTAVRQEKESLEEQFQQITKQLQETTEQVSQMHGLEYELKQVYEECQTLRKNQTQLREELEDSQDQLLEANTKLTLAQSQHMREVQQLREKVSSAVPKEQLSQLQNRLLEEQQKVQKLQEKLRFHAEQTNRQLAVQQEEHEKLLRRMEERMEDVEMNLKNVRVMLQEKVNQLREQLEKNAKSDLLLKDLYVENAQLMKALQVTEQRQKSAEKKNYVLEEKIAALNKVIKKIAPAALAV
ncbi:ninein-like protein [Rhinophrynus dorsalis]